MTDRRTTRGWRWLQRMVGLLPERREQSTEAGDIEALETKPWDHNERHEEIHEHTQD